MLCLIVVTVNLEMLACNYIISANTVDPPNKGHFGNRPVILCLEVVHVPISEIDSITVSPKLFRFYRQIQA